MLKRKRDLKEDYFDNGMLEDLDSALQVFDTNVTPLLAFLEGGNWKQLLQAWSFYSSQMSDKTKKSTAIQKVAAFMSKIAWMLECADQNVSLIQDASEAIREILENHIRNIHHCLMMSQPNITTPALKLLGSIASFHRGALCGDLFSAFDMTLKCFPKHLSTKYLRPAFLRFYLAFLRNGSTIVKRDLISQRKIISGWFKEIGQDPQDLVEETLTVLKESILLDPAFSKTAKISFFNDWMMGCLVKMFSRNDEVPNKVADVLRVLCTDSDRGVKFVDRGWYNLPGAVQNKLLLTVLRLLKPWEDVLQQDVAIDILAASPELVAAFASSIGDSISFDPKLSSFWTSYATFFARILRLEVPDLGDTPPPVETVVENVLPSALSKSAVSKSLTNDCALIRYFAAQILVHSLSKLQKVGQVYKQNKWDFGSVSAAVLERFVDVQVLSTCLSTLQHESLMKTVIMKLVALYCKNFPEALLASKLSLPGEYLEDLQNAQGLSGLRLIQAQGTLTVQARISKSGKWYNKTGKTYSTFTNLLRLGAMNQPLSQQVCELVIDLTRPTLLFQLDTLAHPVYALMRSLQDCIIGTGMDAEQEEKLWGLVDESVARCMRSPYKYVDDFVALNLPGVLSPFLVTVTEQWKFVGKPCQAVDRWVGRYLEYSRVIGETVNHPSGEFDAATNLLSSPRITTRLELAAARYQILHRNQVELFDKIDSGLSAALSSKPFFTGGILELPRSAAYYQAVKRLGGSEELRLATEELTDDKVRCDGLWLGVQLLNTDTKSGHVFARYIDQKTSQRVVINASDVEQLGKLTSKQHEAVTSLERNIELLGGSLDKSDVETVMKLLAGTRNETLLCMLIKSTGEFSGDIKVDSISVAAVIAQHTNYVDAEFFAAVAAKALDAGLDSAAGLTCVSRACVDQTLTEFDQLDTFLQSVDGELAVCPEIVTLVASLCKTGHLLAGVKLWARKVCNWLATREPLVTPSLENFAKEFSRFVSGVNIWGIVPKGELNAMALGCVKVLHSEPVVDLVTALAFTSHGKPLDHAKLFDQIVVASEMTPSLALLVWKVYLLDPKRHSIESVQDKLLAQCKGTTQPQDVILLDVVRRIEARLNTSFVNRVFTWTFVTSTGAPLYAKLPEGLAVSIDTAVIKQSTARFTVGTLQLDPGMSIAQCHAALETYTKCHVPYDATTYDPESLLMALSCSPELFKDGGQVDIKLLVECGGLAFITACLAHPVLYQPAKQLINTLWQYFVANQDTEPTEEPQDENAAVTYRERLAVRAVLGKILYVGDEPRTPCVYTMLAQLVPIVCNPGHYMYVRAIDWLFAGPGILDDLPLYKQITTTSPEDGDAVRQTSWLIEALANCCLTAPDVALMMKRGVADWIMTLGESCYASQSVKAKIRGLLAALQEAPHGAAALTTRHAAMSWNERRGDGSLQMRLMYAADPARVAEWTGDQSFVNAAVQRTFT